LSAQITARLNCSKAADLPSLEHAGDHQGEIVGLLADAETLHAGERRRGAERDSLDDLLPRRSDDYNVSNQGNGLCSWQVRWQIG